MTDTEALRSVIHESGLKYKSIAQALGLTPYGLQKKIDNITEFKASEIALLADILSLSEKQRDAIFFASKCDL